MKSNQRKIESKVIFFLLILFGINLAIFYVYRYGGQWVETDTASMKNLIQTMQYESTLTPKSATYPFGFLFHTFSALTLDLSGLDVGTLQIKIYPILSIVLLIVCAWNFYYQTSQSAGQTALAILMLCFQAEMLFAIFRGSHEKLDWALMMLSISLIYNSLEKSECIQIISIILFYLIVFAQISINIYFASTFLTSIFISLVFGVGFSYLQSYRKLKNIERPERLLYIILAAGVLLFIFTAYLYIPALNNIRTLKTIFELVKNLFLSPDIATQPYDYISFGWINVASYLSVSIFTWILIIGSMLAWFWRGWRLMKGQELFSIKNSLDWLLFLGFALQVGISILIDFSGALSANLQLRVFPGFTVMGVIILSKGLIRLKSKVKVKPIIKSVIFALLLILITWLSIGGLLKASNEPLLSNQWMLFSRSEISAVEWNESHLKNMEIWTGIDSRIRDAYNLSNNARNNNIFRSFEYFTSVRYVIYSERDYLRAERIGFTFPDIFDWMTLYDNGETQVLKKPPNSPFQK